MKIAFFLSVTVALLALSACAPSPTPVPTVPPTPMPTISSSPTPPQQPPTPTQTPGSICPSVTVGTQLLTREQMGYCLLYLEGYIEVDTDPTQVCLVPGEPYMACHTANFFINVEDAAGRTVDRIADEMIAGEEATIPGIEIQRENLTVSGEQAIMLEGLSGVAASRVILIAHAERLYRLTFVPWDKTGEGFTRIENLYNTVISSFTFVPISVQSPVLTEASTDTGGSAVVVFVKDGDVLVWEEATGQTETIFDSGDVIRVELSDDGELVAFLRRSFFEAGGFDRNEQSALWVVERDGANPRELVSAEQLRALLSAAETDSTNFPRLRWIPDTHRLLYSGNTYDAHGYGEGAHTPLRGVYMVDVATSATTVLAPAEESFHFVPSPDGRQIALVTNTGLRFVDVDSGHRLLDFPVYPIVGDTGWFTNSGVWTQDSKAFVINALVEPRSQTLADYALWRVPVDGAPAALLITFAAGGGSVLFAPDGSDIAFIRGTIMPPGVQVTAWLIAPLAEDLGPLAVPSDTFDYAPLIWSPGGTAYVWELQDREEFHPLCPNAVQDSEVCGSPIRFGEQIEWFEWIDRSRFLYVTYQPRRLYLGSLDGSTTMIAEDPPSFAAVAATCGDDSEFVSDVTVPDGTPFAPDTLFRKTWRIRNTGTCTWDASYRLTFLSGDRLSGPRSAPLGGTVQPDEEVDLSVTLIAPLSPGTYQGQWQLFAPDGTPFGTAPYVVIQVP